MKPELTFRRSLRLIAKRWWLLLLCGVLLAAAAFAIVGMKKTQYALYTDLSIKDYSVSPKTGTPGFLLQPANPNFPDQWVPDDFVNSQAAITTSRNLGGEPTPDQILAGLTMGGLTNSTVRLSYTGTGSASQAFNVLKQYTTVLLNQRADKEQVALAQAIATLQTDITTLNCNGTCPAAKKIEKNQTTLATLQSSLPGDYSSTFDSVKAAPQVQTIRPSKSKTILAVVGGFFAGLVAGALLALLIGRMDDRVRRPDDIEVRGVPVVDIDSASDPASVQLLRSELELAGVGTRLAVIAVARSTRDEGSSGLALALARTFAGVGTPTILVSADLRTRKVRPEHGLSDLLEGRVAEPPLIPLAENLKWLPEGDTGASPDTLFSASRVERIVRGLRGQAAVVVIDTPAVNEDAETLPLIACSDVVLLTARPRRTRWDSLGAAVALIQRVAKRPLHICYDRAPERSSVPASERSDVAERVHTAIEVPAG